MNALKLMLILTLTFALAAQTVLANQEAAADKSLGEKLLRQL